MLFGICLNFVECSIVLNKNLNKLYLVMNIKIRMDEYHVFAYRSEFIGCPFILVPVCLGSKKGAIRRYLHTFCKNSFWWQWLNFKESKIRGKIWSKTSDQKFINCIETNPKFILLVQEKRWKSFRNCYTSYKQIGIKLIKHM